MGGDCGIESVGGGVGWGLGIWGHMGVWGYMGYLGGVGVGAVG